MVSVRRKWMLFAMLGVFALTGCGGPKVSQRGKAKVPYAKSKKRQQRSYPGKIEKGMFIWPSEGPVNSVFGWRWGRPHDGIDIGGDSGDPILATATGEVVYSDRLGGYGNLIVLKHPNGLFSAYAHNKKNLVKTGSQVHQGQLIARMGATGNATGEHLHFEIRDQQSTYDPQQFLPQNRFARSSKKRLTASTEIAQVDLDTKMREAVQSLEAQPEAGQGARVTADSAAPPNPAAQEAEVPSEAMTDLLSDM
jgi:Membrane proteins related to metalloendopeptidases